MNNYYIDKYQKLLNIGYTNEESFIEIYHIYLDKKNKKIPRSENNKQFWSEFVELKINLLPMNELFIQCLVVALKEKYFYKILFITNIIELNQEVLLKAIRNSKIFLDKSNKNFQTIKHCYYEKNLHDVFFRSCDILYNQKQLLENERNKKVYLLKEFGYLDLVCAISLFMMKNINENINPIIFQMNGNILTKILHDRLKIKDKRKRPHDDESIKRLHKIIMPQQNYEVLDRLERVFELYKKIYNFEENVLATFCYDDNFKYEIEDNVLELNVICHSKYKDWYNNGDKINLLFEYFSEQALKNSIEFMSKNIFGYPENDKINKFVNIDTLETYLLLQRVYGVSDDIAISKATTLPLYESIHSINNLRGLYLKYFLPVYLDFLREKGTWHEAWKLFYFHGMKIGKMRFPLICQKEFQFAANMVGYDSSITETDRKNIESFFTFDLRKAHINKEEKIPNLFEKPLLKLDGFVLIMPFVLGAQNSSTPFINNLLNVHFKRTKFRKKEVHDSEENLSEAFRANGFNVKTGYMLPSSEKYNIGDIDLICEKDGYLFILELKSTYIRTSLENIWNYKNKTLRKASNQLYKRKRLINDLLKIKEEDFISFTGEPKGIYYWIIDTSFEYDHELIDDNLKVSMFELIYVLNGENEEFYPNGFDVCKFIELIESGSMWNKLLREDINITEINYKIQII